VNNKDFPISLVISSIQLRQGMEKDVGIKGQSQSKNLVVDWNWVVNEKIRTDIALGAVLNGQLVVIEPNGNLQLPLNVVFSLLWHSGKSYRFIELDIATTIEAIHPKTSTPIANSTKIKHIAYRGLVFRDRYRHKLTMTSTRG